MLVMLLLVAVPNILMMRSSLPLVRDTLPLGLKLSPLSEPRTGPGWVDPLKVTCMTE
jgi:hypothetical protein